MSKKEKKIKKKETNTRSSWRTDLTFKSLCRIRECKEFAEQIGELFEHEIFREARTYRRSFESQSNVCDFSSDRAAAIISRIVIDVHDWYTPYAPANYNSNGVCVPATRGTFIRDQRELRAPLEAHREKESKKERQRAKTRMENARSPKMSMYQSKDSPRDLTKRLCSLWKERTSSDKAARQQFDHQSTADVGRKRHDERGRTSLIFSRWSRFRPRRRILEIPHSSRRRQKLFRGHRKPPLSGHLARG